MKNLYEPRCNVMMQLWDANAQAWQVPEMLARHYLSDGEWVGHGVGYMTLNEVITTRYHPTIRRWLEWRA